VLHPLKYYQPARDTNPTTPTELKLLTEQSQKVQPAQPAQPAQITHGLSGSIPSLPPASYLAGAIIFITSFQFFKNYHQLLYAKKLTVKWPHQDRSFFLNEEDFIFRLSF
jgi:hypothetical protein